MKKPELVAWDSAEYLETEEDMALYLEACMEEAPDDARLSRRRWAISLAPRA